MTRTRVVIQSRLSSSRLPGKALATVAGMPLVELVARRAARSGHEVVVATSEEPYDDLVARHCAAIGIEVVRGSLDDVLGRFVLATADLDPQDRVVRLTGDNPVADADLVDELVAAVDASGHTYGRVDIDRVPEGIGAEVFSAAALRQADASTRDPYDREHVTPWLRRTLGELLFVPAAAPADVHAYRATVDTLHDLVRVSALFEGVEDPVAVPWSVLMGRVVDRVDALGPRVPATAPPAWPPLVLSARAFSAPDDGTPPPVHMERLRGLVAEAVDRGVTLVEVGGADGRALEILRSCLEPALSGRLRVVLRVRAQAEDLAVDVERDLARLGTRRVDTLVLDGPWAGGHGERHLTTALGYVRDGVADRLGVVVRSPGDAEALPRVPGLAWVEVPPTSDDATRASVRAGVDGTDCAVASTDPGTGSVHLVVARSRDELGAALRRLAAG